ncbi:MAG: phosphoglycerol geranylgeranyltransferase [Halobacteriota archaeon]|nr:phosphoglycerol geranylgeranyltransferase [Halobacteriota archaeon]
MFWERWKHITKLDPDKTISKECIGDIVDSGTDAIMISGTQNITNEKITELISLLKDCSKPKILEPVDPQFLQYDGIDYVFVPSIINTDNAKWMIGKHKEWVQNHEIKWDLVVPEAYMVLNPNSAVGRLTGAKTGINADEATAYALCAEKYFNFPIVYIEYSGTYGDPEVVKSISDKLEGSRLFYGGGIDSREKALEMKEYADTIVVGNVLYDDLDKFFETIP